jgi:hypothetical protein
MKFKYLFEFTRLSSLNSVKLSIMNQLVIFQTIYARTVLEVVALNVRTPVTWLYRIRNLN